MNTTKVIEGNKTRLAKGDVKVKNAIYLDGYKLSIEYTDGLENVVDFSEFFLYNSKKYLGKYRLLHNFKKFKIEQGNIVWGPDWDLIFPVSQLYKGMIEIN